MKLPLGMEFSDILETCFHPAGRLMVLGYFCEIAKFTFRTGLFTCLVYLRRNKLVAVSR